MKEKKPSLDGFVPRRSSAQLGSSNGSQGSQSRSLHTSASSARQSVGSARPNQAIGRADISESLRDIDATLPKEAEKKLSRRQRKKLGLKRPWTRRRKIITGIVIVILVALLAVGGYLAYKFISNGDKVFTGNIFDIVQSEPLKKDANGRSNFVVFGTAEDDEGGEHGGANLTDSIMVISVDQEKNDAYMISLPRDLWVQYETGGTGKLNAAYTYASDNGTDEAEGAAALQRKAGEILGLDVQYYVHLNFTAVVDAVNAVDGVTVTVESNPKGMGILDRNFDWKCNYKCYYVKYDDGQVAQMDGEHALAFARARNAQGGYGLAQGNFDREKNQQKVITALREKAMSAGTLTNLGKVTGLLDAMGNNLRTNIQKKEIRTVMQVASEIPSESIKGLSFVGGEDGDLVTTGNVDGQSIVRPVAGLMNYSGIQRFVKQNLNANPITKEAAKVSIYNGGRAAGSAQTESDRLSDEGFTVGTIGNAPEGSYGTASIYQIAADKTASATKLAELYGVTLKTGTPPVGAADGADFIVILGDGS